MNNVIDEKRMLKKLSLRLGITEYMAKSSAAKLVSTQYMAQSACRWNVFYWANEDKMTIKEKIWFLSQQFYENTGYYPNINNPKSYNEKMQWLKLYYHDPLYTRCTDKYEFKNYIKEVLGEGYTVPLLGVYDTVDNIDFDKLPDKFVLKTTNAGGGTYGIHIVKDKNKENINELKYKFNDWLQDWMSVYYYSLDWGYKNIKPRIIAEEYIEQIDNQLYDYKFSCFHGEPKFFWIDKDRFNHHIRRLYDIDKKPIDVAYIKNIDKNSSSKDFPKNFDKMVEIARKVSKPFPFVRVDFYEVNDKIYIGEFTFYTESGFGKFEPVEWDYKIGEYLNLSKINTDYIEYAEMDKWAQTPENVGGGVLDNYYKNAA